MDKYLLHECLSKVYHNLCLISLTNLGRLSQFQINILRFNNIGIHAQYPIWTKNVDASRKSRCSFYIHFKKVTHSRFKVLFHDKLYTRTFCYNKFITLFTNKFFVLYFYSNPFTSQSAQRAANSAPVTCPRRRPRPARAPRTGPGR